MKLKIFDRATSISLLSVGVLMACGTEPADVSEPVQLPVQVNQSTIIDGQLEALESANTVEDSLQNNVDKRHQEMLKQGI